MPASRRTTTASADFSLRAGGSDAGLIPTPTQAEELAILRYVFGASLLLGVVLSTQATQILSLVLATVWVVDTEYSPSGYRAFPLKNTEDSVEHAYLTDYCPGAGSPLVFAGALILSFAVLCFSIAPLASYLVRQGVALRPW